MCKVILFEIMRILIRYKTTSHPPLHHFLQNLLIHEIGQNLLIHVIGHLHQVLQNHQLNHIHHQHRQKL